MPRAASALGRSGSLRVRRRGDWLPWLLALATAAIGLNSLVAALDPDLAWRTRLLQSTVVRGLPGLPALAAPAGAVLVLVSVYLAKRRRRAWRAAFALALLLVPVSIARGRDVDGAALALGVAALLWWGREAFHVEHPPLRLRRSSVAALAVAALTAVLVGCVALVAPTSSDGLTLARELVALAEWHTRPVRAADAVQLVAALIELLAFAVVAYAVFRPLGPPRALPDGRARELAGALVREHGSDTLAAFKLRRDVHYLFSPDGRAFLAYRVQHGVLLVAGDPVGPPDALPDLVRATAAFAEVRGLKIGALGVGADAVPLWERAGLRALYLGDEAIVETARFSLEGRAIRKVRQSVARCEKAGYGAEVLTLGAVEPLLLAELESVSERWLAGAPERGFCMALDSLRAGDLGESLVVVARAPDGRVGGFLHYVPAYGRPAVSLSAMRRDHGTPNGLTEFLVARSIELLRARGVEDVSLNFAAFGRYLREPGSPLQRALGGALRLGDRFFQIERLLRFNAKFFPRWEPRYLLYEGALALPRTGLAGLLVEGQLPAVRLPVRRRAAAS